MSSWLVNESNLLICMETSEARLRLLTNESDSCSWKSCFFSIVQRKKDASFENWLDKASFRASIFDKVKTTSSIIHKQNGFQLIKNINFEG